RSRLNSRFTLDRGAGIQLKHYTRLGGAFLVREIFSLSQGDGRNVTEGFVGGFSYTFKLELLPFGEFASKGDYVGGAIKRETSPKLALGVSYDIDDNAVRERGHLGTFITDDEGNYYGHTLNTFCADLMFKYLGFSLMGEYAIRDTESHNPVVFDKAGNEIGTYYTGSGVNVQAGYMFDSNWELAARYTALFPDMEVAENEDVYTIAISKYIVGHKLKVQTDFSYFDRATSLDSFMWRTQAEFHF
ncbi:MAG: hypothetical protein KDC34_18450, partial [Saprospiraceae bacterium]|nr:hypothetical protein [Saprospiraceae bacterium]